MKPSIFCLMILALTFAIGVGPAQAQDLAALAKKTRAERMKVKQERSVRVWNNDNLPRRPAGEGPTAAGGMSPTAPPDYAGTMQAEPSPPFEPEEAADTSEIDSLRDQIRQAGQGLKGLEGRLTLAEDELSLLRIQQASELSPETQAALAPRISEKNAEIAGLRQQIDKAKKDIEGLEKDFKAQGGTLEEEKK